MTIKDKILEELRKGRPLGEIRREFPSVSKTYEALRQYLDEADKIVEEKQKILEDLKNAQMEEEKKLSQLKEEKVKISQETEELAQLKEKLTEEVTRRTEELHRLNDDIDELSKRGYSPEILRKIRTIEARAGPQLLSQLETVEKFNKTRKEFSRLKRINRTLEKEIRAFQMEKTEIEKAVISESNRLDELKTQTAVFEEAVEAVLGLLDEGYSVSDIMSLRRGLTHLQIRGDPKLSIRRLVEGLRKLKRLHVLEEKVTKTEKKLAALKRELAETKQETEVVRETAIKTIEDERDAALMSIDDAGARAKAKLEEAAAKFEATLRRGGDYIRGIAESVKEGLGEWSNVQQKIGKLKDSIFLGEAMLGIMTSTQYLKEIPPSIIASLLDRLLRWSELNYPELTIKPSQNIHRKEFKLNPFSSYKLTALIAFSAEGLRETILQENQKSLNRPRP